MIRYKDRPYRINNTLKCECIGFTLNQARSDKFVKYCNCGHLQNKHSRSKGSCQATWIEKNLIRRSQ